MQTLIHICSTNTFYLFLGHPSYYKPNPHKFEHDKKRTKLNDLWVNSDNLHELNCMINILIDISRPYGLINILIVVSSVPLGISERFFVKNICISNRIF